MESYPNAGSEVIRYAGYDTKTGRIVHTHAQFSVPENRYVEIPVDELRSTFSANAGIVAKLSDGDPESLDFIKMDPSLVDARLASVMVDTVHRKLVRRPRLVLSAERNELTGDGQDSISLDIVLVNEHGQAIEGAAGAVQVTTTRGKLSARGGVVNLVDGKASITLASANETVRQVRVMATGIDHPYAPAHLDLEFV